MLHVDTLNVAIRGFMEDFAGVSAFMDIDALHRRQAQLTADLAAAEERWLLAQEELEALPAP